MISVIIPTLNEEAVIEQTVRAAAAAVGTGEIIVADGGSSDRTVAFAQCAGATVIEGPRGRGAQLAAGAARAIGDVLWFLHADTLPPPEAGAQIAAALADPAVVGGNFNLRFGSSGRGASALTYIYPHLGKLGLCYGDSGFFMRRSAYEAGGGFRAHPIFEDLDLLRRLRRQGRFVRVNGTLNTSARRWENRSFAATFIRWTALQLLYWAGVPPHRLARLYLHIR